ncbi:MAG: hypothetical protein ACETWM_21695 [Candidatus Lokiarchaeia archaeon]
MFKVNNRKLASGSQILILFLLFAAESAFANLDYSYRFEFNEEFTYQWVNKKSLINPGGNLFYVPKYFNRSILDTEIKFFFGEKSSLIFRNNLIGQIKEKDTFTKRSIRDYVKEAYLSYWVNDGYLFNVGKENITGGICYAFTPTDYFQYFTRDISNLNDIDNQEKKNNREGEVLLKNELFFDWGNIMFAYGPEFEIGDFDDKEFYLIRLVSYIGSLASELSFFRRGRNNIGLGLSYSLGRSWVLQWENIFTRGSDIKTIEESDNFIPPFNFIERSNDKIFIESAASFNYTAGNGLNIIGEYFYKQAGYTNNEWESAFDSLGPSNPKFAGNSLLYLSHMISVLNNLEVGQLGKHYFYLRAVKPNVFVDKLEPEIFCLTNLQDGSAIIGSKIKYSFLGRVQISITLNYFVGEKRSEFGLIPRKYDLIAKCNFIF